MTALKLGPGVYTTDDGTLHFDIGEMLVGNGYADTPHNREELSAAIRSWADAEFIDLDEIDESESSSS